ncbi:MAG: hypothetical protein IPJ85_08685 [Flavobacteriales bacterium]|nr:hypothetical protein [Flavobacteriales bacterium]
MLIILLMGSLESRSQHLVQAAVDGITDAHHAREASLIMQQQDGVLMARFDALTRNMMLHVSPSSAIDAAAINGLLANLNIRIRCFSRKDSREGPFRHIDAERCSDNPMPER